MKKFEILRSNQLSHGEKAKGKKLLGIGPENEGIRNNLIRTLI